MALGHGNIDKDGECPLPHPVRFPPKCQIVRSFPRLEEAIVRRQASLVADIIFEYVLVLEIIRVGFRFSSFRFVLECCLNELS